jgi:predicted phage terminase large subunit-like protein
MGMSSFDSPPPIVAPADAKAIHLIRSAMAARQIQAERHLIDFVRQAWPIVEPNTEFVEGKHINLICEHLEALYLGQIRNLLINIPPRCSKSLLTCVFFFCWVWIHKPWTRWMFASYAQQLSTRDSLKCRSIITSQWYQEQWGAKFQLRDDANLKTRFDNTRTGFRLATSVEGMGTGEGGTYQIIDDPHNVVEGESELHREAVLRYLSQSMITRSNDPGHARRCLVMQRLHHKDASAWAIEQGWEHLMLPMEYEPERRCQTSIGCDWRTQPGELLCPGRIGPKELAELKLALREYGTAGQLQQRPSPKGGSIFKREWFRVFRVARLPGEAKLPSGCSKLLSFCFELLQPDGSVKRIMAYDCWWFQTCDTATSTEQEADYTVVLTGAVTPDNELLIWEVNREHLLVPLQYGYLIAQRERYDCLDFQAVEAASSGIGLIQTAKMKGTPFRVLKTKGVSKVRRATAISIMYENGNVYHRGAAPWLTDFEDEILQFPRGVHDDQCLIAGTMIETEYGPRAIEAIRIGDLVWTRRGLRRVSAAGMTSPSAETMRLTAADGRSLQGTAGHPVWVDGSGFTPLDAVTYGGILSIWDGKRTRRSGKSTSYFAALRSAVTPILRDGISAFTSGLLWLKSSAASKACTGRSGSFTEGRSPKDTRFITKTKTRSIIRSTISNASRSESTGDFTPCLVRFDPRSSSSTLMKFGTWLLSGIVPKKAGLGTVSTPKNIRGKSNWSNSFASTAASLNASSCPCLTAGIRSIAIQPAARQRVANLASTMKQGPVSNVGRTSLRTSTASKRCARTSALAIVRLERVSHREPVYNLTVEGEHEYFANGILVHNCDAVSYAGILITEMAMHSPGVKSMSDEEWEAAGKSLADESESEWDFGDDAPGPEPAGDWAAY